jgi:hypothetical protein
MKSRLKHPIRAIREPFGTAGLIVACIALVAALGGTALAAAKLNSTQKKEVEKIAKKFAGKPGAQGLSGTNGTNGTPGTKGEKGDTGATGKSVVTGTATSIAGGECPEVGGVTVQVEGDSATKKHICNGETGFTDALPSEKTETGTWALATFQSPATEYGMRLVPVSFPIPLETELDENHVHVAPNAECPGTTANPKAKPGNFCVYTGLEESGPGALVFPPVIFKPTSPREAGASKAGAILQLEFETGGALAGTWAVTAE